MLVVLIIILAPALLAAADLVRWKILVGRELKRRELVRIRAWNHVRITPAKGFRVIETCTCERNGKKYQVVILNRGWLRAQLSLSIRET